MSIKGHMSQEPGTIDSIIRQMAVIFFGVTLLVFAKWFALSSGVFL